MHKLLFWPLLVGLIILSVAAALPKLLMMDHEVAFYQAAGLAPYWMLPLGLIQLTGAALSIPAKYRRYGTLLMALGFALSAAPLFLDGNHVFAAISLIPALLALVINRAAKALQ